MTKYRKGPTKDRKGALRRTAKEHYRLGCRKLAPIEISGALYSNARQDSSKLAHSLQYLFCACLVVTSWGLAAGYQPRPQVVDRGTTTRYGGQLRYKRVFSPDK